MSTFFAGLDWASQTHAVCIIDAQGAVRERFDVTHDAAGLETVKPGALAEAGPQHRELVEVHS